MLPNVTIIKKFIIFIIVKPHYVKNKDRNIRRNLIKYSFENYEAES